MEHIGVIKARRRKTRTGEVFEFTIPKEVVQKANVKNGDPFLVSIGRKNEIIFRKLDVVLENIPT